MKTKKEFELMNKLNLLEINKSGWKTLGLIFMIYFIIFLVIAIINGISCIEENEPPTFTAELESCKDDYMILCNETHNMDVYYRCINFEGVLNLSFFEEEYGKNQRCFPVHDSFGMDGFKSLGCHVEETLRDCTTSLVDEIIIPKSYIDEALNLILFEDELSIEWKLEWLNENAVCAYGCASTEGTIRCPSCNKWFLGNYTIRRTE